MEIESKIMLCTTLKKGLNKDCLVVTQPIIRRECDLQLAALTKFSLRILLMVKIRMNLESQTSFHPIK